MFSHNHSATRTRLTGCQEVLTLSYFFGKTTNYQIVDVLIEGRDEPVYSCEAPKILL